MSYLDPLARACPQCKLQTERGPFDDPHPALRVLSFRIVDQLEGRCREAIYKCSVCGSKFKLNTAAKDVNGYWRLVW